MSSETLQQNLKKLYDKDVGRDKIFYNIHYPVISCLLNYTLWHIEQVHFF